MTVNLTDPRDAEQRGWGHPPSPRSDLTDVHAGGIVVPVQKRVAGLVAYCLDQTVAAGYKLHPGECWGYAARHILNDPHKPWSNHAWGLAVDLNAPENGYGAAHGDFPPRIAHSVWNPHGFRWGGDYHTTKDWMHFEFMGTPHDAEWLTKDLKDPPAPHPAHHPPRFPGHPLKQGAHGDDVRKVQAALKIRADGIFGPKTAAAVKAFKRSRGLPADGVMGVHAWEALFHGIDHRATP